VLANEVAARRDHLARRDLPGVGEHQARLLLDLAGEALEHALAAVDLAAGKLPLAGQRIPRGAADEQHAAVGLHERAGDPEGLACPRERGGHASVIGSSAAAP
jgi:hypothetical protein